MFRRFRRGAAQRASKNRCAGLALAAARLECTCETRPGADPLRSGARAGAGIAPQTAAQTYARRADFKLTINSNLVGAWTGSAPASSPFKIRATYGAARLNRSTLSKPYAISPPSFA